MRVIGVDPVGAGHEIDAAALIGRRFGLRVALRVGETVTYHRSSVRTLWMRCDCGDERAVPIGTLLRGAALCCRSCADAHQGRSRSRMWRGFGAVPSTWFNVVRKTAARRGIAWNVTIEDVDATFQKQGGCCALSGRKLEFHRGKGGRRRGNASLDRIDNDLGYQPSNIQFVTKDVNIAKAQITSAEFVALCRDVVALAEKLKCESSA